MNDGLCFMIRQIMPDAALWWQSPLGVIERVKSTEISPLLRGGGSPLRPQLPAQLITLKNGEAGIEESQMLPWGMRQI